VFVEMSANISTLFSDFSNAEDILEVIVVIVVAISNQYRLFFEGGERGEKE